MCQICKFVHSEHRCFYITSTKLYVNSLCHQDLQQHPGVPVGLRVLEDPKRTHLRYWIIWSYWIPDTQLINCDFVLSLYSQLGRLVPVVLRLAFPLNYKHCFTLSVLSDNFTVLTEAKMLSTGNKPSFGAYRFNHCRLALLTLLAVGRIRTSNLRM